MSRPSSQISPYEKGLPASDKITPSRRQPTTPHQRDGDRASDDDDASRRLPRLVRYRDLIAAGIVTNYQTLNRLVDEYDFPAGFLISPNIRVWDLDEVEAWLAARPVSRKAVSTRKRETEAA